MMANLRRRLAVVGVGAILAFAAGSVAADATDWNESAYCVGALSHTKEVLLRLGAPADAAMHAQRHAAQAAIVSATIGRDGKDAVKARDLMALGRADAQACWDQMDMCFDRGSADMACMEPAKKACLRSSVCSR